MVQASTRLGRTCILSEHEADLRIVRRVAVISAVPVRISRSSPLTVARMTKGPWLPCPSAVQGPRGFSTAGAIILCLFLRAIRPLQQCPRLEVGVLNCWGLPASNFNLLMSKVCRMSDRLSLGSHGPQVHPPTIGRTGCRGRRWGQLRFRGIRLIHARTLHLSQQGCGRWA